MIHSDFRPARAPRPARERRAGRLRGFSAGLPVLVIGLAPAAAVGALVVLGLGNALLDVTGFSLLNPRSPLTTHPGHGMPGCRYPACRQRQRGCSVRLVLSWHRRGLSR